MSTSIILSSHLFLFFAKMFFCGFVGCILLGIVHLIIDIKQNPNGWKFGKEFCDSEEDDIISFHDRAHNDTYKIADINIMDNEDDDDDENENNHRLRFQRIPVRNK